MIRRLLINWAILAVALGIAGALIPGIDIKGGFPTLLWVALLFGLVNAILGPILRLIALPLTIITFGLFAFVVDAALLAITAGLSDNLDVGGVVGTIVGAIAISVLTSILQLPTSREDRSVQHAT